MWQAWLLPSIVADDFAALRRAKIHPDAGVDGVGHEANAAVAQRGIDAARVLAAGKVHAQAGIAGVWDHARAGWVRRLVIAISRRLNRVRLAAVGGLVGDEG